MIVDIFIFVVIINYLLFGVFYISLLVIFGDWLVDELEGVVEVGGFIDGLFCWLMCKCSGCFLLIFCGDLLCVVCIECVELV